MNIYDLVRSLPRTVQQTVTADNFTFEILTEDNPFTITAAASRMPSGRLEVKLHLHADSAATPPAAADAVAVPDDRHTPDVDPLGGHSAADPLQTGRIRMSTAAVRRMPLWCACMR